jgi:hypothetical protein
MTEEGRRGILDAVRSACRAAAYLNIGLQRTSACGLAAEAGSLGGERRLVSGLFFAGVIVYLSKTIAPRRRCASCIHTGAYVP